MTLSTILARGFDRSSMDGLSIIIRCSQCEALVISGVPAHETGCPNARRECRGCNAMVPMNQKYCDECLS